MTVLKGFRELLPIFIVLGGVSIFVFLWASEDGEIRVNDVIQGFDKKKQANRVLECLDELDREVDAQGLRQSGEQGFLATLYGASILSQVNVQLIEQMIEEGYDLSYFRNQAVENRNYLSSLLYDLRKLVYDHQTKDKKKAKAMCDWVESIMSQTGGEDIYSKLKATKVLSSVAGNFASSQDCDTPFTTERTR